MPRRFPCSIKGLEEATGLIITSVQSEEDTITINVEGYAGTDHGEMYFCQDTLLGAGLGRGRPHEPQ